MPCSRHSAKDASEVRVDAEQPIVSLQLDDGTEGVAQRFSGELLVFSCSRAYPPGRPLSLNLQANASTLSLAGRCIGSKRQADESYIVRMRLTNLRREDRTWLQDNLRSAADLL